MRYVVFGIIFSVFFFVIGYSIMDAWGEEELKPGEQAAVHHHPGMTELVDQFYSSWKLPYAVPPNNDRRTASCCNKVDCEPRDVRFRNGQWEVHWLEPQLRVDKWLVIPAYVLEDTQPDPRESPDGRSHVCINKNQSTVLCAVLGSLQ